MSYTFSGDLGGDRSKKIYMYALMQQQAAASEARRKAEEEAAKIPVITVDEEMEILEATMPIPVPEVSFLRRNAMPLFIGGGVLTLGLLGMILLIKV